MLKGLAWFLLVTESVKSHSRNEGQDMVEPQSLDDSDLDRRYRYRDKILQERRVAGSRYGHASSVQAVIACGGPGERHATGENDGCTVFKHTRLEVVTICRHPSGAKALTVFQADLYGPDVLELELVFESCFPLGSFWV